MFSRPGPCGYTRPEPLRRDRLDMAVDLTGVEVRGAREPRFDAVLTSAALAFVAQLQRDFNPTREELLRRRAERQARIDAGEKPDFLPTTREVRQSDWRV